MAKRLGGIGVESTEARRLAYREILFTTPRNRRIRQWRDPLRRDRSAADRRRHHRTELLRAQT